MKKSNSIQSTVNCKPNLAISGNIRKCKCCCHMGSFEEHCRHHLGVCSECPHCSPAKEWKDKLDEIWLKEEDTLAPEWLKDFIQEEIDKAYMKGLKEGCFNPITTFEKYFYKKI